MLRLNNKGQSLVLFVILIPIILMLLVLVYDVGSALYEKERLDNTSYLVIDYGLDNIYEINENDLIELTLKNNSSLTEIEVLVDRDKREITVNLSKDIRGFIGNTFRFDLMKIKSSYVGYFEQDKKRIERAG